jgi:hypothetical protein
MRGIKTVLQFPWKQPRVGQIARPVGPRWQRRVPAGPHAINGRRSERARSGSSSAGRAGAQVRPIPAQAQADRERHRPSRRTRHPRNGPSSGKAQLGAGFPERVARPGQGAIGRQWTRVRVLRGAAGSASDPGCFDPVVEGHGAVRSNLPLAIAAIGTRTSSEEATQVHQLDVTHPGGVAAVPRSARGRIRRDRVAVVLGKQEASVPRAAKVSLPRERSRAAPAAP